MKQFKFLAILAIIIVPLLVVVSSVISKSNTEIELRNRFEQKEDQRKAFFDKMHKTLSQKSQIAVKNDSSFRRNVEMIMESRKDAFPTMMKWIQESNPNADYEQVSIIYQDLSRAVEAQREGFFTEEKVIQDIVREHKNLLRTFPSGFILSTILGRKEFNYKPISSEFTDEVFQTGRENNVNLNL